MSAFTRNYRLTILPHIDAEAQKRAKRLNATCTKGCHWCCKQIVYITEPEGLLIAETLLRDVKMLRVMLPKLREGALYAQRFGPHPADGDNMIDVDRDAYWLGSQYCTFLVDGLCSVYDVRPVACRTYYVASDPATCNTNDLSTPIAVVDCNDLIQLNISYAYHAAPERRCNVAPLANAVLWGLGASCKVPHPSYSAIRAAREGILSPAEWCAVSHSRISAAP